MSDGPLNDAGCSGPVVRRPITSPWRQPAAEESADGFPHSPPRTETATIRKGPPRTERAKGVLALVYEGLPETYV